MPSYIPRHWVFAAFFQGLVISYHIYYIYCIRQTLRWPQISAIGSMFQYKRDLVLGSSHLSILPTYTYLPTRIILCRCLDNKETLLPCFPLLISWLQWSPKWITPLWLPPKSRAIDSSFKTNTSTIFYHAMS